MLPRLESPVELGEPVTRGPDGEVPVWYPELNLTAEEVQEIKDQGWTAALIYHLPSDFMNTLAEGSRRAFDDLGIEIVAETNAEGDQAVQASQVESALQLRPDIMLAVVLDQDSAAQVFQPALDAGVTLAFGSTKPRPWKAGEEFVSLVTYDWYGLGAATAQQLIEDFDGTAKVGMIYYDADFIITNQREAAFEEELAKSPGIEVVDKQPVADLAQTEQIASAMITRNPDIQAIFAPWDTPAEGVVAALRGANRPDIKVYTIDLGATNALDMASCGNIRAETSTLSIEFGYTWALAAAAGRLGKEVPPMIMTPAFAVTRENLEDGWEWTFDEPLPDAIAQELEANPSC